MTAPPHPGEMLRQHLPVDMTIEEIARRLGISRVQLSRILNGHSAITAEMAIRVGIFTATAPDTWLARQMQWDLWRAARKPLPEIEPLPRPPA